MKKYVVLLCDGMADKPCPALGNKTPMELADKPAMDALAAKAEVGMVKTVPVGMTPGSDVANLSVLGYNPADCYTGRSPLEAANIGIDLADDDVAFRCNLVTLSDDEPYDKKTILDYCAGDIHTKDADTIVKTLQKEFGGGEFDFYTGTAYRHCMVWHGGKTKLGKLTPPHDITGRVIDQYLPLDPEATPLLDMMRRSYKLLKNHPTNVERVRKGLSPANSMWLWGQGKRPQLNNFEKAFGVRGAMISAVDLLKGIGRLAGMKVCSVEGATGYIDTNYTGKMQAALDALNDDCDFAYIHVEAPDECGHRGEPENKVKAITDIDHKILSPLLKGLEKIGSYSVLILPDHPTPLTIRTHISDPVPYLFYNSEKPVASGISCYTEATAATTGVTAAHGYDLLPRLLHS